jgi:hypothetical protein
MSLKLLTFKTNQTILGDVEYISGVYTVKKPVQVIVQPTKDGPMMGFSPFLDYCLEFSTGIEFVSSDILTVTTPAIELSNQYNQVFGSGIQIASSIPKF